MAALARRIGPQKYNAWFKNGTCATLDAGRLKIGAANPFIANWIESHFVGELSHVAHETTGQAVAVSVCVDPVLSGHLRQKQLDVQADLVQRGTSGQMRRPNRPAAQTLRHRLDDFVVGSSNQLAHSAAQAVVEGDKTTFNPLFIHGTCGVGKTHLLQGICNAKRERSTDRPLNWRYLSAEQFTNEFVEAIRGKSLETFRRTYRQLDLLVIDDVHFLASKKATQEEFLHTFNTIEAAGKQVVMASDAHPRMLGQLTEQLVSRFLSGMVVKVEAPDRETRLRILARMSQRLGLSVPQDVIEYVAQHVRGSVRELEGSLCKLSALAGLAKRPVALDLARTALADHLAQADSAVTLGDIETVVASFFGVTPADLHSSRRTHTVSLARAICMFLARRHTPMSYPEIGRFLGKNHSSAVLAVQRIQALFDQNALCEWMTPGGTKTMPVQGLIHTLAEQLP